MTESAAVTWQYVRDWLVRVLMIDDEWLVDGANEFTWWPWLLEQRIAVTHEGVLDDGTRQDSMLRVTATIDVLTHDDAGSGAAFVQNANASFPFGAWVWRDGVISLTSSLALNPLCLDLLPQFRDACLIQAAHAHLMLREVWDEQGERALVSQHPASGLRRTADDLLAIYADGEFQLDVSPDFDPAVRQARQVCTAALAELGVELVHADDVTDVYDFAGRAVALSVESDSPTARAFGPGLAAVVMAVPPGRVLTPGEVNTANLALADATRTSHLGVALSNDAAMKVGSPIRTMLSYPYLAGMLDDVDGMGISILNALSHAVSAATDLDV